MKFMPINFGENMVRVYGGPYFDRPADMVGIKLALEIDLPCDISLPIRDYSIPNERDAKRALLSCMKAIAAGRDVYVGCWGGKGRTGLFMAILAKAAGVADPVSYVRATYNPHAIETAEQADFVKKFPVFWLRWSYRALAFTKKTNPKLAPKL